MCSKVFVFMIPTVFRCFDILIQILEGLELLAFSLLEIRNPGFPGRPGTAGSSSAPGTAQGSSSMNN